MRRKRIRDAALYTFIVKQKWFEKISSPHIIRICLGVLRTLGFYINFHQSAINGHQCCVLAHASPLSVLKHALGRKCSLMATPSKRDSVNAQSMACFARCGSCRAGCVHGRWRKLTLKVQRAEHAQKRHSYVSPNGASFFMLTK